MVGQSDNCGQIEFGRWRFATDAGDLTDGKSTTRLEPQVAKLLAYFLTHQNVVISRDELMAAVWENRIVSDDAINRCVSILRQTLSPDDKQAYIETVVRKGYLAHFPPSSLTQANEIPPTRNRSYVLLAVLVVLVVVFVYTITGRQRDFNEAVHERIRSGPPMVAVLPFTSASQGSDSEFFAHGIHNDLLTQLAKLQSMRVISATSVMEYRGVAHNIRKIGEELGADVILEGSVQIVATQIRINAQLIDTSTDAHLWAESYDRSLSPINIFDVQSEIARAIAKELHTTLTVNDNKQLTLIPTRNMAAYRAFHRAMQIRETSIIVSGNTEYIQALEEAVELDPTFSRAWAELVMVLTFKVFGDNNPQLTLDAEQALQRLQAAAPGSADHLIGQAAYVYYVLKDYNLAHEIISEALTMNPSDVRAIEIRSYIERRQGDFDTFLASRMEVRKLDPRNLHWTYWVLRALLITHRYDEAWAEVESSSLETFHTDYVKSLFLLRNDRNFKRFQDSVQALGQLYEGAKFISEQGLEWEAHIANRDYPGALESLAEIELDFESLPKSYRERSRLLTYWLMDDEAFLTRGLPQWKSLVERNRNDSGGFEDARSHIASALLFGIQGNTSESVQQIQQWYRHEPVDWANRTAYEHEACRILGMTSATKAAVKCIRDGLVQPSFMMPFLEPYLPFYDSIRDEPEFIEMLTEIDGVQP